MMKRRFRPAAGFLAATAALCLALGMAGCGGGGGGSVTQVPGGTVPRNTPALLVGDSANANAIQVSQTLAGTGYKVDFAPSVPSSTDAYRVVVIDETAQISAGSAATVKGLLDQGKGVVLLGRVPAMLAAGSAALPADLTPIAPWFGGVTQMKVNTSFSGYYPKVRTNPLVGLPTTLAANQDVYSPTATDRSSGLPNVASDRIGANSAQVVTTFLSDIYAFAYLPASGGRVYWQWSATGTDSGSFAKVTAVFAAGTRWAAGF